MTYHSVNEMVEALMSVATVAGDHITVTKPGAVSGGVVDRLAATAALGSTPEIRGTARWMI
ncbi:MAG: hypothetical protein IMZ71_05265, partial [Chloroflexi bacterium]|nr:hypothetical protein [Chloroflexota bacterium]